MALIAAHLDAGIIHLGGDSVYSNMPEFCDEDGYDSPHKDQLKIFGGASAYMLIYPKWYHDKNQEVCYGNYAKRHKIFQSHFLKMAAITLSNFKWPQLQYFLDDSLHLNTKIITRICSF